MVLFALPTFAFEIPQGKTINKDAVLQGIATYTQKISANPQNEDLYINRAFLYFLSDKSGRSQCTLL